MLSKEEARDIWNRMTEEQKLESFYRLYPNKWVEDILTPIMGIVLDDWQKELLSNGKDKRILLNIHRQAGKSTIVAIKAVHSAFFNRDQTILIISPTQRQSSELHHTIRRILRGVLGNSKPTVDNVTSTELPNGSRIISLPGSEWTIRSYHANLIICDESAGIPDEVFAALSPMLLTTNGTMILLSTPQGQEGFFWDAYNQPDIWKKYERKVQDNPRMQTPEKLAFLEQERQTIGSRLYSQEYECAFLGQIEGGMFRKEWFKIVKEPAEERAFRVRYWDGAITSEAEAKKNGTDADYTVGTLMARRSNGKVVIEDVRRMRVGPMEKQNLIYNTTVSDGRNVLSRLEIEGGSQGKEMEFHYSKLLAGYPFQGEHPTGNKIIRAQAFAAACERGDVELLEGPWNKDFIEELVSFPLGTHDDAVDSSDGAYNTISSFASRQRIRFF